MSDLPIQFNATIDTTDVDQVLGRLMERISGNGVSDFLRGPVHEHFKDDIAFRFASEGDGRLGFWPALAPATQSIRKSLGYGPDSPINVRTGEMFMTLEDDFDVNYGADWAELVLPGNAASVTARKKIATAQGGSDKPPTPPRPVLGMDEVDAETVLASLAEWITVGINL